MNLTLFNNRAARVLVAEESGSGRQLLSDVVRGLGFLDIIVAGSVDDVLRLLETEYFDWFVSPLMVREQVNTLHVLQIISSHPELKHVRASLVIDPANDMYVETAFALGALSSHPRTYVRDEMLQSFRDLLEIMRNNSWRAPLTAATYLRRILLARRSYPALVELETALLDLHPGSPPLLLTLGEAQLRAGDQEGGLSTLYQAGLIDDGAKTKAGEITQKVLGTRVTHAPVVKRRNVLGVGTCVVIDPDSAVLGTVKTHLAGLGVTDVQVFEDGDAAHEWLVKNPEPDLIMKEWRLRGMPGPILLQRLRDFGFVNVPMIVMSSLIKPVELPLLREMGVDNVIPKPFGPELFFKSLIWTVQQHRAPTEQKSLERKIRCHLQLGQIGEAERLRRTYDADERIPTAGKKLMEAEFAYAQGRYRFARDVAIDALKRSGDSLLLLNLIGKCLMKLGDFDAALKFFEKANKLSPANIEHLCNMASSQFEAGEHDAAGALLLQARSLDSNNQRIGELACQHAIVAGLPSAKEMMAQLPSVERIVGYMNNRAVALTRTGRYDDGISLYRQTLQALPDLWSDVHDAVAYNLGLAFARYGELDKAQAELEPITKRPAARIHAKAVSLAKRLATAAARGDALSLFKADAASATSDDVGEQDPAVVAAALASALDVRRGDVCLRGIYQESVVSPEAQRLLANPPRFNRRAAIKKGTSPGDMS